MSCLKLYLYPEKLEILAIMSHWLSGLPHPTGMFPCGQIFQTVERTDNFTNVDRQKVYSIKQFINCSTAQVFYIHECPYKKFYARKMKRQLHIHIGENLRSIKNQRNHEKPECTSIAQHFDGFHKSSPDGINDDSQEA